MSAAKNKKLVIDERAQNYAKIYSSLVKDDYQRKRAYASITALYGLFPLFEKLSCKLQKSMTLFRNPVINEKYEVTDFYVNDWHLDVRVVTGGDAVLVPKIHYDVDIVPDFYIVVQIDSSLTNAELVGIVDTKDAKQQNYDSHYHSIPFSSLISFKSFLEKIKEPKRTVFSKIDHEIFNKSYLDFIDDNLDKHTEHKFLRHLFNCEECRSEFCCFTGFEMVCCNASQYPEIMEDHTLGIVGANSADDEKYEGKEETIYFDDEKPADAVVPEVVEKNEGKTQDGVNDILDELFNEEDEEVENKEQAKKQDSDGIILPMSLSENEENTVSGKEKETISGEENSASETDETKDETVLEEENADIVAEGEDSTTQKVIVDYDETGEPIYSYVTNIDPEKTDVINAEAETEEEIVEPNVMTEETEDKIVEESPVVSEMPYAPVQKLYVDEVQALESEVIENDDIHKDDIHKDDVIQLVEENISDDILDNSVIDESIIDEGEIDTVIFEEEDLTPKNNKSEIELVKDENDSEIVKFEDKDLEISPEEILTEDLEEEQEEISAKQIEADEEKTTEVEAVEELESEEEALEETDKDESKVEYEDEEEYDESEDEEYDDEEYEDEEEYDESEDEEYEDEEYEDEEHVKKSDKVVAKDKSDEEYDEEDGDEYEEYEDDTEGDDGEEGDDEEYEEYEDDDEATSPKGQNNPARNIIAIASIFAVVCIVGVASFFGLKNIKGNSNNTKVAESNVIETQNADDMFGPSGEEGGLVVSENNENSAPTSEANNTNQQEEQNAVNPDLNANEAAQPQTQPQPIEVQSHIGGNLTEKDLVPQKQPVVSADANRTIAGALSNGFNAVSLRSVNWMFDNSQIGDIVNDNDFKKFLKEFHEYLEQSIKHKLVSVVDVPPKNSVTVKFAINKQGKVVKSIVSDSCGLPEVDNIVLQSINETSEREKSQVISGASQLKSDYYYLTVVIKF